jgi:hypothetical protein
MLQLLALALLTLLALPTLAQTNNSGGLALVQDADVNRIWWAGIADPNALSESDRLRFNSIVALQVNAAQQAHTQFLEGAITQQNWSGQQEFVRWLAIQPGFIAYWEDWSSMHDPDFAKQVAEATRQSTLASNPHVARHSV